MEDRKVWCIIDEWSNGNGYSEESGKTICGIYDSKDLAVKEARTILRKRKKRFKDYGTPIQIRHNTLRNKCFKHVSYSYENDDTTFYHDLIIEGHTLNNTFVY